MASHNTQGSSHARHEIENLGIESGSQSIFESNVPTEIEEEDSPPRAGRGPSSKVWDYCTKDRVNNTATCLICKKNFKVKPNGGTGTLRRHLKSIHPNKWIEISGESSNDSEFLQTQLHASSSGLRNFQYSQDRARRNIAEYVLESERPLNFADDPAFEKLMKTTFQPQFQRIPRNTLKNEIGAIVSETKSVLQAIFASLNTKVCLTCDCWTSRNRLPYMCITAHWVDSDWVLQKRIISFRTFTYPHSHVNIHDHVVNVLREYCLETKIFSISFDNASNNNASIPFFIDTLQPIYNGKLFHVRCCCHIINLIVQDGLGIIKSKIKRIRKAIKYFRTNPVKLQEFHDRCRALGLKPKQLQPDMKVRWNSTYKMLRGLNKYKRVLVPYYNSMVDATKQITDSDWETCMKFSKFLQVFHNATTLLSAYYYPTSSMVLYSFWNISELLRDYSGEEYFIDICPIMKMKLTNYFEEMPLLYTLSAILDPRFKKDAVQNLLTEFYIHMSTDEVDMDEINHKWNNVCNALGDIYTIYASNYYKGKPQSMHGESSRPVKSKISSIFKKPRSSGESSHMRANELEIYMLTPPVTADDIDYEFDVLAWWKAQSSTFPVLSTMARDLLTVPVSTVASESAFSLGRRLLSEFRSSLSPETLEKLVCGKDWMAAETRQQHLIKLDMDLQSDNQPTSSSKLIIEDLQTEEYMDPPAGSPYPYT